MLGARALGLRGIRHDRNLAAFRKIFSGERSYRTRSITSTILPRRRDFIAIDRVNRLSLKYSLTRNLSASANTPEVMPFQAETSKLLDIVTHSIYTDKEVFVRELISNASDALEKYRYTQVKGEVSQAAGDSTAPLHINIIPDPVANTLTIIDNGIGMTKEELVSNLGTIARSGSKMFVEQMKQGNVSAGGNTDGIIGQFGVGFYSSFMVADSVSVESISATATDSAAYKWSSTGTGTFQVEKVDKIEGLTGKHGSKIVMKVSVNR